MRSPWVLLYKIHHKNYVNVLGVATFQSDVLVVDVPVCRCLDQLPLPNSLGPSDATWRQTSCHNWFRYWLVWFDGSKSVSEPMHVIYANALNSIIDMSLKITNSKLLPHFPRASEVITCTITQRYMANSTRLEEMTLDTCAILVTWNERKP